MIIWKETGLQSEFKLDLHYYIHFQINTFGKGMKTPFISRVMC